MMPYKPFKESVYHVVDDKSGISAELLAYSINDSGDKIATFKLVFHRYVAEQFLKHRMFSCNATSSRAMSVPKMNEWIENNTAMPVFWGAQQKGMSPKNECVNLIGTSDTYWKRRAEHWINARDSAILFASDYWDAGYHQQIPNRLTHAFQMASYIVTATEFDNFFNLRLHDDAAQDEIKILAKCMKECLDNAKPNTIASYMFHPGWHMPYVTAYERVKYDLKDCLIISAARCAIVSYNNHTTDEPLPLEKAKLIYSKLIEDTNPHYTPLEHAARIETIEENELVRCMQVAACMKIGPYKGISKAKQRQLIFYANLRGWLSNRYCIENNLEKKV